MFTAEISTKHEHSARSSERRRTARAHRAPRWSDSCEFRFMLPDASRSSTRNYLPLSSACGLMQGTSVARCSCRSSLVHRSINADRVARSSARGVMRNFKPAERPQASSTWIAVSRLAHHQQGGGKLDASDSLHCLWSLLFRSFISSEAELGRASVVVWHTARERTPSRVRTLRTQLHRKTVLTAAARTPGGGGGTDSPNARRDNPTRPNIGQYVVTIDT